MMYSRVATIVVLVIALASPLLASIENKPVKVTHKNSGPRYEIEETFDKTKLTPVTENNQNHQAQTNNINTENVESPRLPAFMAAPQAPASEDDDQIGHIAIRRIFLVPMMRPSMPADDSTPQSSSSDSSGERNEAPFAARPSFWPFGGPSFPGRQHNNHHIHLVGQDTASRPPMMAPDASEDRPTVEGGERENSPQQPDQQSGPPMADPVQMLVDMMRHAINQAVLSPNNFFNPSDLNNNNKPQEGQHEPEGPLLFRPPMVSQETERKHGTDLMSRPSNTKPETKNESSEEIVEINGKKYIRKTVINRHIGENIVFVTRRLIFVPLNETNSEDATTTTTTTTTVTPISTTIASTTSEAPSTTIESKKLEETSTSTTTTTTTTEAPTSTTSTTAAPITTEEPISTAAPSSSTTTTTTTEVPPSSSTSTTEASKQEETTTSASMLEKLGEKLMEASS